MDGGNADIAGAVYLWTAMDGGNADIAGAIYLPGILYLHRHSPPLRETDSVPLGVAPDGEQYRLTTFRMIHK